MEDGILDFFMHLDRQLAGLVDAYPGWIYALMFVVVFAETGLIFMAILPGDSLLFAAGALAASQGKLDLTFLFPLMFAAAFCGDQVNWLFGKLVGARAFRKDGRLFNKKNLDLAKRYYKQHGIQTLLMGRFIPVIRSVTPLAAACTGMHYPTFLTLSLIGTAVWTALFLLLGYFIGDLDIVQGRFIIVLGSIMILTMLPGVFQLVGRMKHRPGHGHSHGTGPRKKALRPS
jgi:membrane-associated protein